MKIVVTGSEGSLMQALIPRLLQSGHIVVGIDNLFRYGKPSDRANKDYEFINQDLIDRDRVIAITRGADAIIHGAAKLFGVLGLLRYRADILGDDTAICSNILQACVVNKISQLVYMSSSMVYDSCVQDINVPLTETMTDTCPLPKTDYGLSKLVCERMIESFKQQYGIEYTIWRPFNIVSPHEEPMAEIGFSHVLPDLIKNITKKQLNPLPIIGNGEQIRCFTWIDDVVDIISKYSFCDSTKNQILNVCNVEPTRIKDLAQLIYSKSMKTTDTLEFIKSTDYVHDVKIRIPSIQKLLDIIGPYEFIKIDESVQRCLRDQQ